MNLNRIIESTYPKKLKQEDLSKGKITVCLSLVSNTLSFLSYNNNFLIKFMIERESKGYLS